MKCITVAFGSIKDFQYLFPPTNRKLSSSADRLKSDGQIVCAYLHLPAAGDEVINVPIKAGADSLAHDKAVFS